MLNIVCNFGRLIKGFFELFSLLIRLDAIKFVLLSVFTVIDTICPKIYRVALNFAEVLIIFSFLLSTCNRNTYFQSILRYAYPIARSEVAREIGSS